jgi:hypothetical protein
MCFSEKYALLFKKYMLRSGKRFVCHKNPNRKKAEKKAKATSQRHRRIEEDNLMTNRKNASNEFADFLAEVVSDSGFVAEIRKHSKFGGYLVIRLKPESYEAKCIQRYLCWPSIAISQHDSRGGFMSELELWLRGEQESLERVSLKLNEEQKETYGKYIVALEKAVQWAKAEDAA